MKKINLEGKIFGRLTVLNEVTRTGRGSRYLCKCDCGNKTEVDSRHLREGRTSSCGCLAQEVRSINGKARKNKNRKLVLYKGLFAKFKNDVRKRKRKFSISLTEFIKLVDSDCFYCGAPPSNKFTYSYSGETLLYNGIDRIDNKKEYDTTNIVPCCWRCNSSKNDSSMIEFVKWINNINSKFVQSETFVELTNEMKRNI